MKLLFDENLRAKLVNRLAAEFPGSQHVDAVALRGQPDTEVYSYVARNGHLIASKDRDFVVLSLLHGPPPKVVWLAIGNAGTARVAELLTAWRARIQVFADSRHESLLELCEDAG